MVSLKSFMLREAYEKFHPLIEQDVDAVTKWIFGFSLLVHFFWREVAATDEQECDQYFEVLGLQGLYEVLKTVQYETKSSIGGEVFERVYQDYKGIRAEFGVYQDYKGVRAENNYSDSYDAFSRNLQQGGTLHEPLISERPFPIDWRSRPLTMIPSLFRMQEGLVAADQKSFIVVPINSHSRHYIRISQTAISELFQREKGLILSTKRPATTK